MLMIRGVPVGIDDRILVNAFGYSYQRSERLERWIAELIEDRRVYRYNSAAQMRRAFLGQNAHNHLVIMFAHPRRRNTVVITMTGSRADDEREANRRVGLRSTPAGYTWHHCGNIVHLGAGWRCRMVLIATWYHRHPHVGGVHEYELMTNRRYR